MATRGMRSVSLSPGLARAIDEAAAASSARVSVSVAETSARRLRLDAGRRGAAVWGAEHGRLTAGELAEGLARARELLGRTSPTPFA